MNPKNPIAVVGMAGLFPGAVDLDKFWKNIINKVDTADWNNILKVLDNVRKVLPEAAIVQAASPIYVKRPETILGRRKKINPDDLFRL